MVHAIRLAVIALVGYLAYDIITFVLRRNQQPVPAPEQEIPAGEPIISGPSHRGKVETVRDSNGANRRRTVGRGVVS